MAGFYTLHSGHGATTLFGMRACASTGECPHCRRRRYGSVVADDDWRLRIELGGQAARGLLARLSGTDARNLAHELETERLAVSHDEDTVFVYAGSPAQLDLVRPTLERELSELSIEPREVVSEHWLEDEDRWDSESPGETMEEETADAGYAPWEVRIPCQSHREARDLADRLEAEGYGVLRRWSFVIAGTATREEAEELAARLHGEVEPGGELVWEATSGNPFTVFGGLGSDGTPL
jgi:hypothetical protein